LWATYAERMKGTVDERSASASQADSSASDSSNRSITQMSSPRVFEARLRREGSGPQWLGVAPDAREGSEAWLIGAGHLPADAI